MNVHFVIYGDLCQTSGGYLYDRMVVGTLRKSGHRVRVTGLRKVPFPLSIAQSLSPRLRRLLREGDGGCVVIDELVHPAVFMALPRPRAGLPAVVTLVHHLRCSESVGTIGKRTSRFMEKRLLSRSRSVVVNSSTTAATVSALLGREADLHICRPGKDAIVPSTAGQRERLPRGRENLLELLTVGNLIPRKGHLVLFTALSAITDLDWRCTVVGGGGSRSYLRKVRSRVSEPGLRERITFAGRVSDEDLFRLYRRADLFLFPSEYEGYGIALAEAISQGTPYVAWDRGAVRELVSLGGGLREGPRQRGGYLLPGGDAREMSQVLRALMEDRGVLEELSREAWALSRSLPEWRDTGACFRRALEETVGSERP